MQRQTVAIIIIIASVRVPVSMITIIATCVCRLDNSDQRVVYVSCMEGSDAPIIIPAVITMHCRAFLLPSVLLPPHTLMQLERMRSMVPLQNVVMMGGGALAYLSLRRKLGFLS